MEKSNVPPKSKTITREKAITKVGIAALSAATMLVFSPKKSAANSLQNSPASPGEGRKSR